MTRDKVSVLGSPETQGKKLVIVERNKAPEGAVAGAVVGGALGIVVGVLLAWFGLPGMEGYSAAAWLLTLSALAAGLVVGGLVGALAGRSMPEHEARLLDEALLARDAAKGGILVGVETHDGEQARRVAGNLEAAGAATVTSH